MATTKSINLFIDANIWLALFHFTSDDLEQFKKLKNFLGRGIRLFVPEQIKNEVLRNRENKIKDALDKFERIDFQFTAYSKHYDEYEGFSEKLGALKALHKEWLKRIKQDVADQTLPADVVLQELFAITAFLPSTPELVQRGVMRYNIGNPPGKDRKYGDAINWETLLEAVPDGEDLYFVSTDKDYASLFDPKRFHPYLAQEWVEKKHSNIIFYKTLNEFFRENVSDIQLYSENEKDSLIEELSNSRSFASTHRIIKSLSSHSGWSLRQIQDMCHAAMDNFQVTWLLGDDDVYEFYQGLLDDSVARTSDDEVLAAVRSELQKITEKRLEEEKPKKRWIY